ncbi:hypothetical protein F5887DRAFT_1284425 [Amanita rubescens]|nr:hypothetical protein F5887DRAFT_1284425 [Amanita rubescens]
MSLDPGSLALTSLLCILNDNKSKPRSSITPVANATTLDLLRRLLSRDDYIGIAEKIRRASDVMDLLEFTLHQDYIGRGGYGNVFKGEFRGTVVALKVLYKNDANNIAFCREALMWGSLKHNFVLPFIGIHEEEDGMAFLVSPYMKNGTLAQWRKNTDPSIAQITEHMLEVAQGMDYIHSEGVVHGDLRGENILLDANLRVQIADFGLTRLLDATNTQSGAKHLNFAAPELFGRPEDADNPTAEDPPRTQMSDVYAFGCIYYEIHYDCIPFAGRKEIQLVTLVSRGNRPPRQDEPPLSDRAWELIQWCWVPEPPKRPRMKDIAEHMMAIYQRVSPPTSARNDGMLQDASLSLSTSSTTVRRTRVVPSTPLQVTFGGFQEYNDEDSFTDAPPFSSPSSPDAHATYHAPISDGLSMSPTDPSQRMHSMSVGITELRPSVVHASQSFASHGQFLCGTPSQPVSHLPAKVKAFNLAVKGIAPLWVGLDALKSQAQLASNTPLALKIQLWTSSASVPLTGHDFSPSLYFTSWTHSEKCITKLFINGQMNSSEHTPLTPTYAGQGYVTVALPEFYLNQYRRLNPSLAIVITQEIVADDQTLLFIVYIMDRAASNSPSAKFLSYRVYDHGDKAAAAQFRPMQDKMRSHHRTIETHRPSQPSNTSSIPTVVIEPTPSSSQLRNPNSFSGSIKSPEAASQFSRHAGPSVPAVTTPEETTVPSSAQQQDLHHNTGAHQLSQPPSAEPHPTANTAAPVSKSSSLPSPDKSYPGNPFRPQFTTSSPQYKYSTAPAASSARFNNVLPPFVSMPYYVNHPTAPVVASSEREPARSDALPPFTSPPYYVNDPTTPAEAGRSGSRSINSLLPPFTSPESSAWPESSAQYTSIPEYTNAPFSAPPQSYASGIPPAPPEVGLAPGYASTSYTTRSTSYPSTPYRPTPDASTRRREESK